MTTRPGMSQLSWRKGEIGGGEKREARDERDKYLVDGSSLERLLLQLFLLELLLELELLGLLLLLRLLAVLERESVAEADEERIR